MATTSLKLPYDLKEQATKAAAVLGIIPHAFMVEAIRQAAHNAEHRRIFIAEATTARKKPLNLARDTMQRTCTHHCVIVLQVKKSTLKLKSW